jgi:Protein of unknown function (DUF2950)
MDRIRRADADRHPLSISEDLMITACSLRTARSALVLPLLTALAVTAFLLAAPPTASAQQTYKTPDAAVDALVAAAKADDEKAALVVFGKDGEDIISSGDKVSDEAIRKRFVESYDAKHHVDMQGDAKAILVIGDNDYPFPIPLVRKGGVWSFDTEAGRREVLLRRIGRNELNAIQTSLAYVDAQNDYAAKDRGAGVGVYAQRFVSEPGKKDGLYWPTAAGQEESPLGELFAAASRLGHTTGEGRSPYHGYYYKILTKQGAAASGGAHDYVVNGKMIGGFALVAYPAQYRNSGVMTFLVNYNGTVYQKDLGWDTPVVAEEMTAYNPDKTWTKADTTPEPAK